MRLLLLGKNGQVGWELQRSLAVLGDMIALDRRSQEYCGDLNELDGLAATVRAVQPDVIVNAAAFTSVDAAETEEMTAQKINALAPRVLAEEALACGALLIHYSTDYVFDGTGERPWREADAIGPLNVYGQSKLAGERAILETGCRALIFRTSWVYSARGGNFATTMLRLGRERDQLSVIADQVGAPTGADLIADVTSHCIALVTRGEGFIAREDGQAAMSGIYHLAAGGETSWHGYATFIFDLAREAGVALKVGSGLETGPRSGTGGVQPISTAEYASPAKRPLNSRLDTTKLQKHFGLKLPHWQKGVARMIAKKLEPHQ